MGRVIRVPSIVGNESGIVLELDDGTLLIANKDAATIKKSTDGGISWETKHTFTGVNVVAGSHFIDSQGNVYFGSSALTPYSCHAVVARSSDNGESWTEVLTLDSSRTWYLAEDLNGDLFAAEYGGGLQDANELYGHNIWKSTDGGVTWSKWFTHPLSPNVAPDYRNAMRHIHCFAIDSAGRKYAGWGDGFNYADSAKTYLINDDGTRGALLCEGVGWGNGMTAFVEADNGRVFFGGDTVPVYIYEYHPSSGSMTQHLKLRDEFGLAYEGVILGMAKGKDGVLYALTNDGESPSPRIIASADDGNTWVAIEVTTARTKSTFITLNRNRAGSRIYIDQDSSANFLSITDYTRAELRALYTSTLTIKTS